MYLWQMVYYISVTFIIDVRVLGFAVYFRQKPFFEMI